MRTSRHTLTRAVMALGLALLFPGIAEAYWGAARALMYDEMLYPRLVVGGLLGVAAERLVFEQTRVYGVFVHELTHAAAARLLGRRIQSVTYGAGGGRVVCRGGFGGAAGDVFISLAPYVFPLFAAALVTARPWGAALLPEWGVFSFDVFLGGVMKLQFLLCLRDLRENWQGDHSSDRVQTKGRTDIGKNGTAFSLLYVGIVSLAMWGVLFATLTGGYAGIALWGEVVETRTRKVIGVLVEFAQTDLT